MIPFSAPTDEINMLIETRIGPAIDGVQTGIALLALLTLFVEITRPDLEGDELIEVVEGAMQIMSLHINKAESEVVH